MGLDLRLFEMVPTNEPVMGGGYREVKVARELPDQRILLNGFATAQGVAPEHQIIGGYGLTHNVDKDFMDEWLKQNASSDLVKNKLVFIREKAEDAVAQAKDLRNNKSGMERLDPAKLPVSGLKTADEQKDLRVTEEAA
jgi:hypothetical protein